MKTNRLLYHLFGKDEHGFPDIPSKISGVQISRIINTAIGGCSWCFPHQGYCYWHKPQKNWKKKRRTQYK